MNETDNQTQDLPEYLRKQEPDLTGNAIFLSEESLTETPVILPEDSSTTSTAGREDSGETPGVDTPDVSPTTVVDVPPQPVETREPEAVAAVKDTANSPENSTLSSPVLGKTKNPEPQDPESEDNAAGESPAAAEESPAPVEKSPVSSEAPHETVIQPEDDAVPDPETATAPPRSADSNEAAPGEKPAPVLGVPSPYPQPELPQEPQVAAQAEANFTTDGDSETTVVRRKSLLGGQTTETIAPLNPPTGETGEPQWQPRPAQLLGKEDTQLNEATVLAGASIKPAKISRAGAHFGSLLTCLLALPFAWAFLKHSHGLLYATAESTFNTGRYSIEGLSYLVLGLALVVIMGLAARLSSLGPFLVGILVTLGGLSFVVMPVFIKNNLDSTLTWLSNSKLIPFQNLSYFLASSGFSGDFLAMGVALLMIGVVGHTARRRGRTDQIADKALAKTEALQ